MQYRVITASNGYIGQGSPPRPARASSLHMIQALVDQEARSMPGCRSDVSAPEAICPWSLPPYGSTERATLYACANEISSR